jgi:hypothetical protein
MFWRAQRVNAGASFVQGPRSQIPDHGVTYARFFAGTAKGQFEAMWLARSG